MEEKLWECVLRINPFISKDEVFSIEELNEWDMLVTFTNGKKVIYDRFTGYHRNIFYESVNELTDKQEKKEFAYRLRMMMKRKYITQKQLAELIGTSQAMISKYINGEALPNVLVVRKIAKVLDCSMDDLFYQDY